jgi:putative SOS response-associated peptidase YedK
VRPGLGARASITSTGFYEWQKSESGKQPYCFEVREGELFAFAGVWDRWKGPTGKALETFSILTTTPNAVTAAVHDRMPVILDSESYDLWLDPGMKDVRSAAVSSRINHVANDDEACSTPVEVAQIQNRLFL